MEKVKLLNNPRIIIIQKLYSNHINKDEIIHYSKHRYKKFIKDIVSGTIEREEIILDLIKSELTKDINFSRTDLILKLILMAAIFEFMYKPQTSINVIISEYLNVSEYFLEDKQKKYLNAILDKISKKIRNG